MFSHASVPSVMSPPRSTPPHGAAVPSRGHSVRESARIALKAAAVQRRDAVAVTRRGSSDPHQAHARTSPPWTQLRDVSEPAPDGVVYPYDEGVESGGRPRPINDTIRERFERQPRRDTQPELAIRKELHRRGLRFFVDRSPLRGMRARADIVFPRARVAVFVNGCFWHSCQEHGSLPRHNREWWRAKLAANQARDERTDSALTEAGWVAIRVWEHDRPVRAADLVESAVRSRMPARR